MEELTTSSLRSERHSRWKLFWLIVTSCLVLVSCAPRAETSSPTPTPAMQTIDTVYTEAGLTAEERVWLAGLEPAGGEGRVGLSFTQDFDHDGNDETVVWGHYTRGNETGNFVRVSRGTTVLLKQEVPGSPQLTAFTLKPDGSLWFGAGVNAGEVTLKITWEPGPKFHRLLPD